MCYRVVVLDTITNELSTPQWLDKFDLYYEHQKNSFDRRWSVTGLFEWLNRWGPGEYPLRHKPNTQMEWQLIDT